MNNDSENGIIIMLQRNHLKLKNTVVLPIHSKPLRAKTLTFKWELALRAVTSVDGMTADWARIPFDVLEKISNRIINEVGHINRIVYDVTSKPPATIEWE